MKLYEVFKTKRWEQKKKYGKNNSEIKRKNLKIFWIMVLEKGLTLFFAMSWNSQTHFKSLAAFAARFLKYVGLFYDIAR